MNFLAIERAWPYVVQATETLDPMHGPSAALAVFAAAMMEAEDFKLSDFDLPEDTVGDARTHQAITRFLKKKLKGTELNKIQDTMYEVLKEAGLEVTPGEAVAALVAALGQETFSPETAPDTLQSSLPLELKEDLGTL
jgi:hypothetical protein